MAYCSDGIPTESFNIMTKRVRTAQQGLEQQVHETNKELETAITDIQEQKENDRKKDEFISLASHELKTPLTTIKAFFQIAINDISPEAKSFRLVSKASRQVVRMERLISDLLDVSRINTGKMIFNPERFDFGTLLTETVETIREVYPDHNLVIEKSVSVPIIADRQRIEQVITNLLNNAVKYSQPGARVLIRSEHDNVNLFLTVEDFGIGIEQEKIGELFKRFNRIDENHRFQGLGLGLFISDEIIKRHGGRILVKSTPGKGSSFTIQLPLAQPIIG